MRACRRAIVFFLAIGATTAIVVASHPLQSYKFTSLEYPGASRTDAAGVNNAGQIVGSWTDASGAAHGFLLSDGVFQSFDVPGALGTHPHDINDSGTIVGSYTRMPTGNQVCCESYGFIRTPDGQYFTVDHPTTNSEIPVTWLFGINNVGQMVGGYNEFDQAVPNTSSHGIHSFLLEGETFTPIDFPFAARVHIPVTFASDINDAGDIVGGYNDDTEFQSRHGFVLRNGTYETLDMPASSLTDLFSVNNVGEIVGESTTCGSFAFLYSLKRGFSCIPETSRIKPRVALSLAFGLNDAGQFVGESSPRSYFATPPSQRRGFEF
jgi:probable HAF family extracellular repeat protein